MEAAALENPPIRLSQQRLLSTHYPRYQLKAIESTESVLMQ
jgi:hypothetical protein